MSAMPDANQSPGMVEEGVVTRFFRATEIDTRMLGMVAALLVIWAGFDIYSGMLRPNEGLFGGSFLTPRNLWTLLVQTSSIAIMSTGMVLLIVMRQLDLSVGSMLSTIAVTLGVLQVFYLGPSLGLGHWSIWIIAVAVRHRPRRADRRGQRRSDRLCRHSRPSSSRWAASSATAASPGRSSAARPSRRWTRPSS